MKFANDAAPRRREDVHRQDLPDGSTLLFDPENKTAYPITESAALVWENCDGEHSVAAIVDLVFEVYEASKATVAGDVAKLLAQLADQKLLEDAPAGS